MNFVCQRRVALQKIAARQAWAAEQRSGLRRRLEDPETGELVTEPRRRILSWDLDRLRSGLAAGEVTPSRVLEAYQARALEATEAKNCVCLFLDEASVWAQDLESRPERERGPLYGVPVSVKECYRVKGYDNTVGLTRFLGQPAEEDCAFVRHLKDLGAVPFCLTNVPQTMKSFGCSNPIYGSTAHPMDDKVRVSSR